MLKRLAAALAEILSGREIMLLAGIGLSGYGAWLVYPPAGFALAGAVMIYVAIAGVH